MVAEDIQTACVKVEGKAQVGDEAGRPEIPDGLQAGIPEDGIRDDGIVIVELE
jgi:hypothetical protein